MYRTLALFFYILLLWGFIKYTISKKVIKEDLTKLDDKYNKYGPFYNMNWEKRGDHAYRSRYL